MEDGFFLDHNTQEVQATVLTFNGNAQQFLLTDVTFTFKPSGIISVDTSIKMFRRWPYETAEDYFRLVLEILFSLLLFYQIVAELQEFVQALKETKSCWQGICLYWSDLNNVVDWISMALSGFLIVNWGIILRDLHEFDPKTRYPVYITTPTAYDCKSARLYILVFRLA